MELTYFGHIDPSNVEEYYDKEITINGNTIEVDINFEEEEANEESLSKVEDSLKDIESILANSISFIANDYDLGDESETAIDYLNHHLDVLGEDVIIKLFGSKNVSKEKFISSLVVQRVGFYPEDEESFMLVDVTLKGDVTNYLMSVTYGESGELSYISMES